MWDNLLRVDWDRLVHAYGRAHGVPKILLNMVSRDEKTRATGWDNFYGTINHQGDFYDSTVAAVPFLVEAVDQPELPDRASILDYFRQRWLDAPVYGGDPILVEPPGGIDEPTPMRTDAELAGAAHYPPDEPEDHGDEELDVDAYRRMDLCAWQTGRAILAGRPVFERLLENPDREVAASAAALLLLWPETRSAGKRALIRTIEGEPDPVEQARRILEFGVYAAQEDEAQFEEWVALLRPAEMRAAAALAWAWVLNPGPLPESVAGALGDASVVDSDAFARLPWVGVWHRGPWILPANAAELILRLADNQADELRWRAVQGLSVGREAATHLPAARVVPMLIERLSDRVPRVREEAALALSQRGESVLEIDPDVVPVLIRSLGDTAPSVCGHAARLLAAMSHRLPQARRAEALSGIDRATRRFEGQGNSYVHFDSMGLQASPFLKTQHGLLLEPTEWSVSALLVEFSFLDRQDRRLSPAECDRRLADAYARTPRPTIAAAIAAVRDSRDRTAAIGAAHWLMTLGPAAEPALGALDAMGEGKLDEYAREQARAASALIRRSLLVEPEMDREATSSSDEVAVRSRIAWLARAMREDGLSGPDRATLVPELVDSLAHPDAYVRARSAGLLAQLSSTTPRVSDALPPLEKLLTDDDAIEIGNSGRFAFEGRLYHWRRERWCPRAEAIQALFQIGRVPEGDRMLQAMIAESTHAAVLCSSRAAPHRFSIAQWRSAVAAAGGLSVADPVIRDARQRCREQAWSRNDADNSAFACEAELTDVIRQLAGRLV